MRHWQRLADRLAKSVAERSARKLARELMRERRSLSVTQEGDRVRVAGLGRLSQRLLNPTLRSLQDLLR